MDIDTLRATKERQCMEAYQVVEVKMAYEEMHGLPGAHEAARFLKPAARVKDYIRVIGLDKDARGVPRLSVIPAVRSEKCYLHDFIISKSFALYKGLELKKHQCPDAGSLRIRSAASISGKPWLCASLIMKLEEGNCSAEK
jgi:hypothetical protein